jgi:DHA2 family multidrug resistance protein
VILDLYPPSKIGQVMALWGAGALLGPIFGPALGGWLTDSFTWRWVFYINLPIGALALAGVLLFMSREGGGRAKPFDFLGFGSVALSVASFQLILDRGPSQDWFTSPEIWAYVAIGAASFYVFLVQTLTARQPFFDRALARDRNFVSCTIFGFFIGVLLFSVMALLPVMLQQFMGYTALESGLATMPRGLGSFAAMFVVGRMIGRVDTRLILFTGLSLSVVALWQMTHFDLSMTVTPVIVSGVIQGVGVGLIFVPLSALAFTTLPASLRAEATAVYTLVRSLGSSVGISIMEALWTNNTAIAHSGLAAHIGPANPVAAAALGSRLTAPGGLEALNGEITRQAAMIAYLDDFKLMIFITLACLPLLLMMRTPRFAPETGHAFAE